MCIRDRFKLVPSKIYVEEKLIDYKFDFSRRHLYETKEIEEIVINMLLNRAVYELVYGYIERSKDYLRLLKKCKPDYEVPPVLEKILNE